MKSLLALPHPELHQPPKRTYCVPLLNGSTYAHLLCNDEPYICIPRAANINTENIKKIDIIINILICFLITFNNVSTPLKYFVVLNILANRSKRKEVTLLELV